MKYLDIIIAIALIIIFMMLIKNMFYPLMFSVGFCIAGAYLLYKIAKNVFKP